MWSIKAAARLSYVFALLAAPIAAFAPLLAAGPERQQAPPQQRPQLPRPEYDTRVDLILVDVNVVDALGRPVERLTTTDFKVSVDGRPRRIQTVQFVAPAAGERNAPPPGSSSAWVSAIDRLASSTTSMKMRPRADSWLDDTPHGAADITIEVAATEDGQALIGGKVRAGGTETTRRTIQAAMPTEALPPGAYVARATLTDRDGASARVVRGFLIPDRNQ